MRLKSLFSATRLEDYGPDSQLVICRLLAALNAHLEQLYPDELIQFNGLRSLLLNHPHALGDGLIDGFSDALSIHATTEPASDFFDLATGWLLDGGDPDHFIEILKPYAAELTSTPNPGDLLAGVIRFSATRVLLDQNLVNRESALRGIQSWIRSKLPISQKKHNVVNGLGVMSWAIFETNTHSRVNAPTDQLFIEYFLEPYLCPGEISVLASTLVAQACVDFRAFDDSGFNSWLKHDFLADSLVFNPALACCLKDIPTRQIVERLTPIISALHREYGSDNNIPSQQQGIASFDVRQGLINALSLFPERLKELGATTEEIAGAGGLKSSVSNPSPLSSNRLAASPIDAMQISDVERDHATRLLLRLESWGLKPNPDASAQAALENKIKVTGLLGYKRHMQQLDPVERFFLASNPAEIAVQDNGHLRELVSALHLPVYSAPARLNMALMLLHRAIDIYAARDQRRMKPNKLVMLTFPDPKAVVQDWEEAAPALLNAFIEKNAFHHKLMVWAGFDSRVLSDLSRVAPAKLVDDFMAHDLGL